MDTCGSKVPSLIVLDYAWKNVSKEAVNLIKSMLERDPSVRISAYEALNSKWINTPDVQPLAITTLENLRNFHVNFVTM